MKKKNNPHIFANICTTVGCPECGSEDYTRRMYTSESLTDIQFPCKCDMCGANFDEIFLFSHSIGSKMIEGKLVER
jgi:hypothetical protein